MPGFMSTGCMHEAFDPVKVRGLNRFSCHVQILGWYWLSSQPPQTWLCPTGNWPLSSSSSMWRATGTACLTSFVNLFQMTM